jgi:hypothetical protein
MALSALHGHGGHGRRRSGLGARPPPVRNRRRRQRAPDTGGVRRIRDADTRQPVFLRPLSREGRPGPLRDLGSKPGPGVGAEMLSIGVILRRRAQLSAVHDAVHAALDAYREALNRNGGIVG